MNPQLSPEQRQALQASNNRPLEVDDGDGHPYVILSKEIFIHLQSLQIDAEQETQESLRRLVNDGIASGDYQPADEVFSELRSFVKGLNSGPAV